MEKFKEKKFISLFYRFNVSKYTLNPKSNFPITPPQKKNFIAPLPLFDLPEAYQQLISSLEEEEREALSSAGCWSAQSSQRHIELAILKVNNFQ